GVADPEPRRDEIPQDIAAAMRREDEEHRAAAEEVEAGIAAAESGGKGCFTPRRRGAAPGQKSRRTARHRRRCFKAVHSALPSSGKAAPRTQSGGSIAAKDARPAPRRPITRRYRSDRAPASRPS